MAFRTAAQVAAGFLAGAVLVGTPTWAVASRDDVAPSTQKGMPQMMSDGQSHDQMMTSMSKMMKDPAMREEMASMMSEAMGQMPGMGADDSDQGMSGMGRMHGMGAGNASFGAPKP